jgi:hypothetical protein
VPGTDKPQPHESSGYCNPVRNHIDPRSFKLDFYDFPLCSRPTGPGGRQKLFARKVSNGDYESKEDVQSLKRIGESPLSTAQGRAVD